MASRTHSSPGLPERHSLGAGRIHLCSNLHATAANPPLPPISNSSASSTLPLNRGVLPPLPQHGSCPPTTKPTSTSTPKSLPAPLENSWRKLLFFFAGMRDVIVLRGLSDFRTSLGACCRRLFRVQYWKIVRASILSSAKSAKLAKELVRSKPAGWIDGVEGASTKQIHDCFTPRRPTSTWSALTSNASASSKK